MKELTDIKNPKKEFYEKKLKFSAIILLFIIKPNTNITKLVSFRPGDQSRKITQGAGKLLFEPSALCFLIS